METQFEYDEKANEADYVASYNYTTTQRVVAILAIIITLCGVITLGVFLTLNIVDLLTN